MVAVRGVVPVAATLLVVPAVTHGHHRGATAGAAVMLVM